MIRTRAAVSSVVVTIPGQPQVSAQPAVGHHWGGGYYPPAAPVTYWGSPIT